MDHIEYIDRFSIRLKKPFDLSFLNQFGTLFWVLDEQSSGNLCFGVEKADKKYFLKFAGAETINNYDLPPEDAIDRLKATIPKYKDLAHSSLICPIKSMEIENGFILLFEWEEGESIGEQNISITNKFYSLPIVQRINVFEEILRFHTHVANAAMLLLILINTMLYIIIVLVKFLFVILIFMQNSLI